ncbi:MAG: BlaI/MecI/CopY family transcriptional regulator [Pirellulales bacterium]
MKCIYRPTQSQESASRFALSHVMNTFFQGSAADTVAAVFDVSSSDPSDEELDRLEQVIERTRKEGR